MKTAFLARTFFPTNPVSFVWRDIAPVPIHYLSFEGRQQVRFIREMLPELTLTVDGTTFNRKLCSSVKFSSPQYRPDLSPRFPEKLNFAWWEFRVLEIGVEWDLDIVGYVEEGSPEVPVRLWPGAGQLSRYFLQENLNIGTKENFKGFRTLLGGYKSAVKQFLVFVQGVRYDVII